MFLRQVLFDASIQLLVHDETAAATSSIDDIKRRIGEATAAEDYDALGKLSQQLKNVLPSAAGQHRPAV